MALACMALAFVALAPAAGAANPSADQIIQSLKPSGDLLRGGTRGIRLANPEPAMSPAAGITGGASPAPAPRPAAVRSAAVRPASPPASAAAARSAAPSVNLNVEFAAASATLTPAARQTLDQLGQALSSHALAGYRFRIEGHTDTVGAPALNQTLSERRARAVAAYLEQAYGVPAARLRAVGMGQEGLLVPTPPQTPNEQNRRVEVINLGT
jgi:OOP family OmpA-OmpF porin